MGRRERQNASSTGPPILKELEALSAQERVVLAGPLAEAEAFAREDLYTVNGVFERVEIHPFRPVFPMEHAE